MNTLGDYTLLLLVVGAVKKCHLSHRWMMTESSVLFFFQWTKFIRLWPTITHCAVLLADHIPLLRKRERTESLNCVPKLSSQQCLLQTWHCCCRVWHSHSGLRSLARTDGSLCHSHDVATAHVIIKPPPLARLHDYISTQCGPRGACTLHLLAHPARPIVNLVRGARCFFLANLLFLAPFCDFSATCPFLFSQDLNMRRGLGSWSY